MWLTDDQNLYYMSFQLIPTIDLSKAFGKEKPEFLAELRNALINVGFLLLVNYELIGPLEKDFVDIKEQSLRFFALPSDQKRLCEMINSRHFLGYTRLANEITALRTDWREQFDAATELSAPNPDEPIYRNVEGPNLWPAEKDILGFREQVLSYIDKMTALSTVFRKLVCEAIGLDPEALNPYFKPNQQCKMKLIAYPDIAELADSKSQVLDDSPGSGQGVGPHRDSDLLTYIFQATDHKSLQVQNFEGEWVTVPNVPGSLVVNGGQTLEALTSGVCKATIHRVESPQAGSGTRISVPFFQTIDLDSRKSALAIPEEVLKLRDERDRRIDAWGVDVGFQFIPDDEHPVGHAVFRNRIKSHQDVAARWYPEILKEVLHEYSRVVT